MNCCMKKMLLFLSLLLGFNNIYSSDSDSGPKDDHESVDDEKAKDPEGGDDQKGDGDFFSADWFKAGWNKICSVANGVKDAVVDTVKDAVKSAAPELALNMIKGVVAGGPAKTMVVDKIREAFGKEAAEIFERSPASFINHCVFNKFECGCETDPKCKTDGRTGVHYREFGDLSSNDYVFFFHGMLYAIDCDDLIEIEKAVPGSDLKSYHFVSIEYNSFYVGGADGEVALGFTDIDDLCDNMVYPFIQEFLRGKNPNRVIFIGHSHGNTYAIRVYAKARENKLINDVNKIGYLGCKGYWNFEETLVVALGSKSLREKIDFLGSLLPVTDVAFVRTAFSLLVGADNYEKIKNNNDNEDKINELIEKKLVSDIVNYKLSKPEHYIKPQDFLDMFGALDKYTNSNPGKPLPVLLFYADDDEYVGEAFKKEIKVNITPEEKTEKQAKREEKMEKEKEFSEAVKELEGKFRNKLLETGANKEKLKEVYTMKTGGMKAFKGLSMVSNKSGSGGNERSGRRCCNSCRRGNREK